MSTLCRALLACAVACTALTATAAPSQAIVGGTNASAGEYPAVAQISFGFIFSCTGTLISPDTVLTAGHCSSITSPTTIASPASYPAATINVRIGHHQDSTGGEVVPVSRVIMQPSYIGLTSSHDISLLKLSRPATKTPVKVSGPAETSLFAPGTMETIVGWGVTKENGSGPEYLQKAQVPIVDEQTCDAQNANIGGIDPDTNICAGYAQGGVDTCQGDSGGPMFGKTSGGVLRVVGATSYGEGCARKNKPGVYAAVGKPELREWIRSQDADGVAP
jgi:secreted trypsin-like serine protease